MTNTFKTKGAYGVDEFCAWVSMGRSKFYREVAEGRISVKKLGRKSIITNAVAEAYLDNLPTLKPSSAKTADSACTVTGAAANSDDFIDDCLDETDEIETRTVAQNIEIARASRQRDEGT